ncbi:MAG: HlyD family efflux transporter periplasmic adaptor subunit [Acidipila sp.]|nr:HlyD family efflux transporter periplasmic adaptor subunit [Acidipila sp.]
MSPGKLSELWNRSVLHRALLVAPVVLLLVAAGYWKYGNRTDTQFFTAKVEKGDITQVVQATGTINAVTTVQVGSQVSGTIQKLFVDFNSQVKQGQVVAQIDPSIFHAQLLQAQADLADSQANVQGLTAAMETQKADIASNVANVAHAQAQLADAKTQLDRNLELFKQGIVAAQVRDTSQSNYDALAASVGVAQAQLAQSRAKLKSAAAQLDQAKAQVGQKSAAAELSKVNLSHTTILAPIDGTVILRNIDVGQTVAASLQAPTLFIIAQDLTKMQVYAKTDEADVGKIKAGAQANFRVDSFPRETFAGRVSQVRMNATTVQNVVTYDTIIDFDNPERKLFPGMTAYVTIPVDSASDAVKIPNGALRFKPDIPDADRKALYAKYNVPDSSAGGAAKGSRSGGGGGGKAGGGGPRPVRNDSGVVWKLLADKSLQPVPLKIGVTDFTFTEMKEGPLQPGDLLVIGQWSGQGGPAAPSKAGGPLGPASTPKKF